MYVSIDIESDGGQVGKNSMVCFGAVIIDKEGKLNKTFYGKCRPITNVWDPESLTITGYSREEVEEFPLPFYTMKEFHKWLMEHKENKSERIYFISDNNCYDWKFMDWYFLEYIGDNPFGYSSINIKNLYQGMQRNINVDHFHLRDTKHSHNPVDDARGNAEAFWKLLKDGLKVEL